MPHTIVYNPQDHLIEMKAWGSIALEEAGEMISELVQTVKEKDCPLILSDYREAVLNLSTFEIYNIPKKISNTAGLSELSEHVIKRALVAGKGSKNFHFFETVTLNQGQPIKLFTEVDKAKKWLLEK